MIGYSQRVVKINRDADMRNLGVRLGRYCIQRELPVKDVMEFFDVSKQTVYNWFAGTHLPGKRHAELINKFLGRIG
jgi:hypothetical protein